MSGRLACGSIEALPSVGTDIVIVHAAGAFSLLTA
jgi:hypothetical protein